jgi:hypothetical protein
MQGQTIMCSMNAGSSACPMTVLATTVNRLTMALGYVQTSTTDTRLTTTVLTAVAAMQCSVFGVVLYFITWIFIAATIIIAIVVVAQGQRSNIDDVDSEIEMI